MKTSELLIQAKALIDTKDKWTQHHYARNAYDDEVKLESSEACKFCSLGALYRATDKIKKREKEHECRRYLAEAIEYKMGKVLPIPVANDTLPHDQMMQIWDTAIELAQKDEESQSQSQTHQG